jgi:hypothetical protein
LQIQFVNGLDSVVGLCNSQLPSRSGEDTVHLYWCADCKTSGCKKRQVFKDIPFDGSSSDEPTINFNIPAKFEMRCKTCGVTHTYQLHEIDDFKSGDSLPLGFDFQV